MSRGHVICKVWGGMLGLLLCPVIAFAADYRWTTNSPDTNTVTIWNYSGAGGEVTIPSMIEGREVMAIGEAAFMNRTNVTGVEFPGTVTEIHNTSFRGSGLRHVVVPDSVLLLAYRSFASSPDLESAVLGNGISYLADSLFQDCSNLTSVVVGRGVTNVGYRAFEDCSRLSAIYFSGDAPDFDYNTFMGVNNAVVYYMAESSGWGDTFAGFPTARWEPVESGYTWITNLDETITLTGYTGTNAQVEIPALVDFRTVSIIAENAFSDLDFIESVTIPDSVVTIESNAFVRCGGLEWVAMGSGVTNLVGYTFNTCTNLRNAPIGQGVLTIESNAFYQCPGMTHLLIPDSVTSFSLEEFYGYALEQVSLGGGITAIPHNLFYNSPTLIRVVIGNGVTNIEDLTFWGCSRLASVSLGTNIQSLGAGAFAGNVSLENIRLPGSVTDIGNSAFQYCTNLSNVAIGWGVHTLGVSLFEDCTALTTITLPSSLWAIRHRAFQNCENLGGLYCYGDEPAAGTTVFSNAENVVVYYQSGTSGWGPTLAGRPTALWEPFPDFTWGKYETGGIIIFDYHGVGGDVVIPSMINGLPVSEIWDAFDSHSNLITVIIPGSVTSIWDSVFNRCPSLTGLYFSGDAPEMWTSISYSYEVVIYHLPGAAGWSNTFGGRPTAIWLPEAKEARMSAQGNAFEFDVDWAPGQTVVVEAASSLMTPNWEPVGTKTTTEWTTTFSDPAWSNLVERYYRFVEL